MVHPSPPHQLGKSNIYTLNSATCPTPDIRQTKLAERQYFPEEVEQVIIVFITDGFSVSSTFI